MPAAVAIPIIYGVAAAAAVAGTVVSVQAAKASAKAQEDSAEYASDIAKYNAKVAENNALSAQQQAAYEADQIRRRNVQVLGRQRAMAAKAGVLISGSVADVIEDSSVQGELDVLTTLYSGAMQANYYKSQGTLSQSESKFQQFVGKTAKVQGQYAVAGGIASGVGNLAGIGSDYGTFKSVKTTNTAGSATKVSTAK